MTVKHVCILFPSSYMDSLRVDEAFEKEYEAAQEVRLDSKTENSGKAMYCGWMMKPETAECQDCRRSRITAHFSGR